MIYHFDFVPTSSKIVIGGLFLGLLAFWLAIKVFQLPNSTFDTLAFVVPISIAVQRIGCFIIGCCFGLPTTLPWGVRYSFGTVPHFKQAFAGNIEIDSMASLPVHPFQIYEILNCLSVVMALWLIRKRRNFKGSLLALSLTLWSANRFLLEFFRDPMAHAGFAGEFIAGLKLMQWLLLLCSIISLGFFLLSRKRLLGYMEYAVKPNPYVVFMLLMVTVFITWYLRDWFGPVELLALNIILLPTIVFTAFYLFQENTYPAYRWMNLSIMVLPLFLMSQTWVDEEMKQKEKKSYSSIRTGFDSGTFYSTSNYFGKVTIYPEPGSTGCDGEPLLPYDEDRLVYENFKHSYWSFAMGYSKTQILDNKKEFTFGADIIYGGYEESKLGNISSNTSRTNLAIKPYVYYDAPFIGIGGGFLLGDLNWTKKDLGDTGGPADRHSKSQTFIPSFYTRIGPEKYFFGDFGYAHTFPSPVPGMMLEVGIGSGFGLPKGNKLRIGRTNIGTYLQANVKINSSWQLSGMYVGGNTYQVFNNFNTGLNDYQYRKNRQWMLGMKYNWTK